jgi:ketosteroid isomerase-like protein
MPLDTDEVSIRRLLEYQGNYDWDGISNLLTDDAVFELPFINERFTGKAQIIERWRPSMERMAGLKFYDIVIKPMADPGWYVATFRNTCTVRSTGAEYDQIYINLFQVKERKIAYFAEYFDTLRLAITLRRVQPVAA